jgi:acyl-CoA reductase-like NAD-dependent aldehyde dehydrogenase
MTRHVDIRVPGAVQAGIATVTAPWDGSEIATVATVDADGADRALANAAALFADRDAWLAPAERIEILGRTASLMEASREDLALEAAREGGKPLVDSLVEVDRAIDGVRGCVEVLRANHGTEVPMRINPASMGRLAFTTHEPIGVVVAVSAFNHPLNLIVHQVGPAVAAGCPVIVKPAGDTPLSCFRFVDILREAGLPDEWCQPLLTADHDVATGLVTDRRVAFFSFIGSADVGWRLRSLLAPGTRAALEHGGAAPVVVAADADLDSTMPLLAKGGFYHAGQVCVSVQRVFADRSVAGEVADRLADLGAGMTIGDPTDDATDVGPLIRPREVVRVAEWVDEARRAGAEVRVGGQVLSNTTYSCTVLVDPPDDAAVSRQEVFGPVISVYTVDDIDEAIARANAVPFAFQAAVLTSDVDTALRCYRRLDASAVMVNDHTAFRVDWMPFAGLRRSGLGTGGIPFTFEEMQIEKLMVMRSPEL